MLGGARLASLSPSKHDSFGLQQQVVMQGLGHRQQGDQAVAFVAKLFPNGEAAQVLQAPDCARQPEKGLVE